MPSIFLMAAGVLKSDLVLIDCNSVVKSERQLGEVE